MPYGRVTPKAVPVDRFKLDEPADLLKLLTVMVEHGYSGALTVHVNPTPPDADGNPGVPEVVWGAQLRSELQPQFSADMGQVVIWDERELRVISREELAERYNSK